MKTLLNESLVSAGTYEAVYDLDTDDENKFGMRSVVLWTDVEAVAGASPSIVTSIHPLLPDGKVGEPGDSGVPQTGVGLVQTVGGDLLPSRVLVRVVASGTITASSLSFKVYAFPTKA